MITSGQKRFPLLLGRHQLGSNGMEEKHEVQNIIIQNYRQQIQASRSAL
jgi:hypothetical protein